MKKVFLTLVAATVAATMSFAQSSMLATLSHDGEISTYYGALALRDAYAQAASGDIITLSSGSFNAVDIDKGITIRGAGMSINASEQTEPTILTGAFSINIPDEDANRLTIEGIYHNATVTMVNFKNGTFLKDRFRTLTYSSKEESRCTNLSMIHCKVAEALHLPSNSPISCINCFINFPANDATSAIEFVNCIIRQGDSRNFRDGLFACSFKNCIFDCCLYGSDYLKGDDNHTVYYCLANNSPKVLFQNVANTTNVYKDNCSEIFKTYNTTYTDNENFELLDEIKESIKGLDGTEVGIYGGNMPFSTTPTNPQITKCNVAAKSTADGKLSVDITVNGAE